MLSFVRFARSLMFLFQRSWEVPTYESEDPCAISGATREVIDVLDV